MSALHCDYELSRELPMATERWTYADKRHARDLLIRAEAIVRDRNATGSATETSVALERELGIAVGRVA